MSGLIEIAIKNKNQIKHYELSSSLAMTIMRLPSLWSKDYNEFKKRMEYFEIGRASCRERVCMFV